MEQALGFAFVLTIAFCVSFYAGRECLRCVIFLICRSAGRSTLSELQLGCLRSEARLPKSVVYLPASGSASEGRWALSGRVLAGASSHCLLSVADHCLRSLNYINIIVADKQAHPQYLGMDAAIQHCTKGAGIWNWASNDQGTEPDVVMSSCGDIPTLESLAATALLRQHLPEVKVRLPWSQFLYAEGDEDVVRLVFATHDVWVKGSGLGALLTDVAAHRLAGLAEPISPDRFLGRGVPRVRELAVRKVGEGEDS